MNRLTILVQRVSGALVANGEVALLGYASLEFEGRKFVVRDQSEPLTLRSVGSVQTEYRKLLTDYILFLEGLVFHKAKENLPSWGLE